MMKNTLFLFLGLVLTVSILGQNADRKLVTNQIAASFLHSYALDANFKLYSWGVNTNGELGLGSKGLPANAYFPVYVDTTNTILKGKNIASVAAGAFHTLVLDSAGVVYAWGKNDQGQLGDGTNTDRLQPVQVGGLIAGKIIKYIGAGYQHSVVVDVDGKTYCWGNNQFGQLGDNSIISKNTPVLAQGPLTGKIIIKLSVGYWHNLAVEETNKELYAWGRGDDGQLGTASFGNSMLPVPVDLSAIITAGSTVRVAGFSAGASHSLAYFTNGNLYGWGYNGHGQLGDGFNINKNYPTPVSSTLLKNVQGCAAGAAHSLAFDNNGILFAWGSNKNAQLGSIASNTSNVPVQVLNGATSSLYNKKVSAISAGFDHSIALTTDLIMSTFGGNNNGQLGGGFGTDRPAPSAINCKPGYYGLNCEYAVCYGIPASDKTSTCSGRGTCTGPDTCQCSTGYGGPYCQNKNFPWNVLDWLFGANTFAMPAGASFFAFIAVLAFCCGAIVIFCFVVILAGCLFLIPFEICAKCVGGMFGGAKGKDMNAATKATEQVPYKIMTASDN